jgi:hypothetical protein
MRYQGVVGLGEPLSRVGQLYGEHRVTIKALVSYRDPELYTRK